MSKKFKISIVMLIFGLLLSQTAFSAITTETLAADGSNIETSGTLVWAWCFDAVEHTSRSVGDTITAGGITWVVDGTESNDSAEEPDSWSFAYGDATLADPGFVSLPNSNNTSPSAYVTGTYTNITANDMAAIMNTAWASGGSGAGAITTLTMSNLTVGTSYRLQILHDTSSTNDRIVAVEFMSDDLSSVEESITYTVNANNDTGKMTTLTFIASQATEVIQLRPTTGRAQFNAGVLHAIAAPEPTGSIVTIDPDGTCVVNGQRTYVIGAFRDPSDEWLNFENVKNAGFNLVHDYRFESQIPTTYTSQHVSQFITDAQTYLIAAENAGLGVFMGLPRRVVDAQDNSNLALIVNSLKSYDALWFWYLYDEPGMLSNLSDVSNAYNVVKGNDPYHPTVFADYGKRLIYYHPMANYVDVPWIDRYFIPYDTFEILRDMQSVKDQYPGKPVWAVPQGHDHLYRQHKKFETEEGYLPYPSQMVFNDDNTTQNPKAIESQVNATMSLDGMQGIIYYWQPHTWHNIMDTPKVWQGIRTTTNQLKALNKVLVSDEDTSDIIITHSGWGTHDRIDELYGYKLPSNQYPDNDHVVHWKRKYRGSVYIGATTTYVPRQFVTIELPFEIGRVVQYPDQKTIMRKPAGQNLEIYEDVTNTLIWNVTDNNTISFILNDTDSAVWRIDPVDPTESVSYSQNFTGTNGTLPIDWTAYGAVDIQGNKLETMGGNGTVVSIYQPQNNSLWEDYKFSGYIKQSYSFPTSSSTESAYCTGIAFKVQDEQNYYIASIKKKAGSSYPSVVISKVVDGVVEDIAYEPMSAALNTSYWYIFDIEVYSSYFKFSLTSIMGGATTTIDAVDTAYKYGAIGVHSLMPSGHYSYYENFDLSGRKLLPNGKCLQVIAAGKGLDRDYNQDCFVDYGDIKVIADNWLGCIADNCPIDLIDLAALANDWLTCNYPDNDNCIDPWQ